MKASANLRGAMPSPGKRSKAIPAYLSKVIDSGTEFSVAKSKERLNCQAATVTGTLPVRSAMLIPTWISFVF